MKKELFVGVSGVSFILFAIVDFTKEVIESSLHVKLLSSAVNFSNSDWQVSCILCQKTLLSIAIACAAIFILLIVRDKMNKRK